MDTLAADVLLNSSMEIFNNTNKNIYLDSCQEIDKLNLSDKEKEKMKKTHFVLFLIKKQMLETVDHDCFISLATNGIMIDKIKINIMPDFSLLNKLCEENSIYMSEQNDNGVLKLYYSLDNKLLYNKTK